MTRLIRQVNDVHVFVFFVVNFFHLLKLDDSSKRKSKALKSIIIGIIVRSYQYGTRLEQTKGT